MAAAAAAASSLTNRACPPAPSWPNDATGSAMPLWLVFATTRPRSHNRGSVRALIDKLCFGFMLFPPYTPLLSRPTFREEKWGTPMHIHPRDLPPSSLPRPFLLFICGFTRLSACVCVHVREYVRAAEHGVLYSSSRVVVMPLEFYFGVAEGIRALKGTR